MRSEILSQERNIVVVKAEYEAAEVDKAVSGTVRELSGRANIKGFRKGHVPRKTLEIFFGRSTIYRETAESLVQQALDTAISDYDLDLVVRPNMDVKELKEGEPLTITFTFEVRPEVKLPDIAELEAEKIVYRVTDDDVAAEVRRLLESVARFAPTDDDRPAEMGDIVEVQYSTQKLTDGETKQMEKDQKSTLTLATLRTDIAEAIVGHRLAEEFQFDIRLEDDYPDKRLAGATLRYDMEILQFMRRELPEESDETAKEISNGAYSTMNEVREELRRRLEADAEARSDASLRESALKALSDASEVDVPDTMIDRQYDAMRRDQSDQIQRDLQQSLEDYLQKNSLSVSEFDENLRKNAAQIVRNTLVINALAERDEISFSSEDMNEEIMSIASSLKINPQELADRLSQNREEFANIAGRVRTRNTLRHLAETVKCKEVEPSAAQDNGQESIEQDG